MRIRSPISHYEYGLRYKKPMDAVRTQPFYTNSALLLKQEHAFNFFLSETLQHHIFRHLIVQNTMWLATKIK